MGEATEFWNSVRSHWSGVDEDKLRPLTESLLRQFRRRLPASENKHLFAALPPEIDDMSATGDDLEAEKHERPADTVGAVDFYHRVSNSAGASEEEAKRAGDAVFAAIIEQLPKGEVDNVRNMLPPQLEAQWNEVFQRTRPH